MACMRPELELPYPAQTLYIRVDEQLILPCILTFLACKC